MSSYFHRDLRTKRRGQSALSIVNGSHGITIPKANSPLMREAYHLIICF